MLHMHAQEKLILFKLSFPFTEYNILFLTKRTDKLKGQSSDDVIAACMHVIERVNLIQIVSCFTHKNNTYYISHFFNLIIQLHFFKH